MNATHTVINLSAEDSKALRDAVRVARRAAVTASQARAALESAQLAHRELVERIAEAHDFDPDVPMQFDERAHTLTRVIPGGPGHG